MLTLINNTCITKSIKKKIIKNNFEYVFYISDVYFSLEFWYKLTRYSTSIHLR